MKPVLITRVVHWLLSVALAAQCWPLAAQALSAVPEYKLKAAFVYNFALFTDWPAAALADGGTFNLCINPDSAMRPALAELGGRSIKGGHIALHWLTDTDAVRNCHVVFLDSQDRDHWAQIKKTLSNANALTVSDDGDIGRDGAVIMLFLDNSRMAFDIDMNAARQAGLKLSSKLLRLARTVR
jgi:hypothetical protein